MSEEIEQYKIKKLPVWAQDYINKLERQRDSVIKEIRSMIDTQTPSPIRVMRHVCAAVKEGESVTFFDQQIQSNSIEVEWMGVELRILLRDKYIDLTWSKAGNLSGEVAMIPHSYCNCYLVSQENMRK